MNWIRNLRKVSEHFVAEAREIDSSARKLRQFGYLVGGILVVLATLSIWRTEEASVLVITSLIAGMVLVILAWGAPLFLRTAYLVWMYAALVLGLVVGTLLLFILFYLIVMPIGLLRRLLGDDPLERSPITGTLTYWKSHEKRGREHMRRPF